MVSLPYSLIAQSVLSPVVHVAPRTCLQLSVRSVVVLNCLFAFIKSTALRPKMSTDEPVCCPPQQTTSAPVKAGPAHPVSAKTGYELKGTIQKLGDFDEVYVVRFLVYEPHLERESNHLTAQTGAEESNHALVVIYDVFGFW